MDLLSGFISGASIHPKAMMHIAYSPYFHKMYKFPPSYFRKIYKFPPFLSSMTFCLIYCFYFNQF